MYFARRVFVTIAIMAGAGSLTVILPNSALTGAAPARGAVRAARVTRVTVIMTEYHFALSKRTVPIGRVVFTVINKGKIGHDFSIPKAGSAVTPLLQPSQRSVLTVVFRKAGRYLYRCTVGEHSYFGMQGYLKVT